MTTREMVMQAVEDLPDDATVEDVMERLPVLVKIEQGLQRADAGQTIEHAQVQAAEDLDAIAERIAQDSCARSLDPSRLP